MNIKDTPVLLLTGYLGSGKTTLVNHILSNQKGIKFAVIVNDIGEVNIDADLIQKGGVVGKKDDSLVALQNGCICCTLKMDLVEQISDIIKTHRFDYIVIEASGICEPEPIAQTICSMPSLPKDYTKSGIARLDCIVTVVDALRMQSEFQCGRSLTGKTIGEEDIENLIIQQIEFCNKIILNKASEVKSEELERIKQIIRTLQPGAEILTCDYAKVELEALLHTQLFDFENVATSAGWIRGIESRPTDEEEAEALRHGSHPFEEEEDDEVFDEDEHEDHEAHHSHNDEDDDHDEDHDHEGHDEHHGEHHHHHQHEHEGGEVEEYGISTFVYYRRPAFDLNKFDYFIAKKWHKNIIRTKGICYFSDNPDMSCLFEQSGVQVTLKDVGQWYATAPEEDLAELMRREPGLMRDWDEHYGDRMIKLVFIGQHLDKEQLVHDLDECLA